MRARFPGLLVAAGIGLRSLAGAPVVSPVPGSSCYRVTLAADALARLAVSQESGDLAIEVRSPGGTVAAHVDSFEYGDEIASFIAPSAGSYKFCVVAASPSRAPLRFTASWDGPRAAGQDDLSRIEAERATTESRALSRLSDAPNLHRAALATQRALNLWTSLGNTRAEAALLTQLGDISLALGNYREAISRYDSAIAVSPAGRPAAEAWANSGVARMRLGEIDEAQDAYDRSLGLLGPLQEPFPTAALENNRGNLFRQTGEFQRALESYRAALPGMRNADPRSRAALLGNIGLTYAALGEYSRAAAWLERSLPLLTAPNDRVPRAVALMNLGRVRALQNDWARALPPLREAMILSANAPSPRTRADVLNNLGQALYRKSDARQARPLLAEAVELYRSVHDVRGLASAEHYWGCSLADLGEEQAALTALRDALTLRQSARLDDDAVDSLIAIARVERRSDRPAAEADLERARDAVEKLRGNVASPDLRATWFATRGRAIYGQTLDLIFEFQPPAAPQAGAAAALEMAERARARSWTDEMGAMRSHALLAAPELAARERRLNRALGWKSQQLALLPSTHDAEPRRGALAAEVADLELQYTALDSEIEGGEPLVPAFLSASKISALLSPDTVLLEFALGEKRSYVWAVTSDGVRWFQLPPRTVLERLARPVAELAGSRRARLLHPEQETRYQAAAATLSRVLFAPVSDIVGTRKIVVSPDGILDSTPFAALPSPKQPGIPLGIAHEISRIPSASTLAAIRAHHSPRSAGPLRIAVFSDPVFRGDSRIARPLAGAATAPELSRLPFSLREAEYVAGAAQGAVLVQRTGFAAAKSALLDESVRRAAIVHFATHSRIDPGHPELSGIFFSQSAPDGAPRESFLSLYDIYDLNLPAELVVISACASGAGRDVPGEGPIGMTRAFFHAGAARAVVSLWPVDDEGTALFMRAFYEDLLKPGPSDPARALRAARETLWRNPRWRDPAYWSGFVLEGDWKPLRNGGAAR